MKIIIGLGNPGSEYTQTRHNVGFLCVEKLRTHLGGDEFKFDKKANALISEANYEGKKILLALPQTFMNNSGEAVAHLVNFYKIAPQEFCVVYDDIDLPFGEIRMRPEGSAGTHNGMKSIIASLGLQNFPRLRIGIEGRGEELRKKQDLSDYVLSAFTKDEMTALDAILEASLPSLLK